MKKSTFTVGNGEVHIGNSDYTIISTPFDDVVLKTTFCNFEDHSLRVFEITPNLCYIMSIFWVQNLLSFLYCDGTFGRRPLQERRSVISCELIRHIISTSNQSLTTLVSEYKPTLKARTSIRGDGVSRCI